MDKQIKTRGKHGGARPGGGRPPKADEVALIQRLSPMADEAHKALFKGVKDGNPLYVKMWFEYFYGKPKQVIQSQDLDSDGNPINKTNYVIRIEK